MPRARMGIYSYIKLMKTTHEIAFGFIIFFIIDRATRLISAIVADRRNLTKLEIEKLRHSIELGVLLLAFLLLINK